MEKFIIISTPRSGSTVLARTLDKHPEIFCAGELFNTSNDIYHPEYHFDSWGFNSKSHSVQRLNRIINYLNLRLRSISHIRTFYNDNTKNEKTRGFKLMFSNLKTAPYMWPYFKKENAKVIVLIRNNVFKTILSRCRKAANRVPHITNDQAPEILFKLPAEKLTQQMKGLETVNRNLIKWSEGMNRHIIYYEDFQNWDETMFKVQDFLGVLPLELPPVLKKIGILRWQDEVENYREIERILQENNFTQYLNE